MEKILKASRLCAGMSSEQICRLIALGNPQYISYEKNDMLLLGQLNENGEIHLNLTREELADYLGIQRPSLSRELSKMQKEGLIRVDHRTVFIRDKEIFNGLSE